MVHGDDFTALGTDASLNLYEAEMLKHFDVELRGRLGSEPGDCTKMKILNRVVRVTDSGLAYEADPRHVERLVTALGLEGCRLVGTPGTKDPDVSTAADNGLGHEDTCLTEGSFLS